MLKCRAHFEIDVDECASGSEPDEPNLLALLARPQPKPHPGPTASNLPASTTPDTATKSESEPTSEPESETASEPGSEPTSESEAEATTASDSESDRSDHKSHIEPSHRAHPQPISTSSQSKATGPPASTARLPSPRTQTSVPSTLHRNDAPQPRAQPSASSSATTSAGLATPAAQAGPSQERSTALPQDSLWNCDIGYILDSIVKLTEARTRQQPNANAGSSHDPQAPSTSASSSAVPAGAIPRPIIGLRSRRGRPQAAAMSAAQSRAQSPFDDPTEVLEQAAAALLGKVRSRRKRPALSDFPGIRRQIASAAIPEMQTQAVTTDPFASPETYEGWASDAYENSWYAHVPDNIPFEPAPLDLCKVIARRTSHFRCKLKERIRPVVFWGYGFRSPVNLNADTKHNRRLIKLLTSDTFHCQDLETDTDQYEHPVFLCCIAEGLFWDLSGIGVLYHHKFNPIPLPAVALVLAMMQFCIQEWRSGRHESRDLNLSQLMNIYDTHLAGLEIYGDQAAICLDYFQQRWFKFGMRYAGAVLVKRRRTTQPTTRAENVHPDTPPADEEGSDRAATQSRWSKGKGWAAN